MLVEGERWYYFSIERGSDFSHIPLVYYSESERNRRSEVRGHLLHCLNLALKPLLWDLPLYI